MYIIIFEDGLIGKVSEVEDELFIECSNGYVDIIRVSDMTTYDPDTQEWNPIKEY